MMPVSYCDRYLQKGGREDGKEEGRKGGKKEEEEGGEKEHRKKRRES